MTSKIVMDASALLATIREERGMVTLERLVVL
jgi:PIN domain nuclease of toxin-antitoxin system